MEILGHLEGNKKPTLFIWQTSPSEFALRLLKKSRDVVEPRLNKHSFALHFKWKELPKAGCLLIVTARLSQLTVEVAWLSEGFFC